MTTGKTKETPSMGKKGLRLLGGFVALITGVLGLAAAPSSHQSPETSPVADASTGADYQKLSLTIDQYIAQGWREVGSQPSPLANDAEFMRRIYLDLAGRIPSVAEARAFLRERSADKREQLINKLLDSPAYANHFANVWRVLLLPEADSKYEIRFLADGFKAWLHKQFAENVGYDHFARELLTTSIGDNQAYFGYGQGTNLNPFAFYLAKEAKPENLGASTARVFLGVKLECAQCHDHPFAKWTRTQFWEFAAFFSSLDSQGQDGFVGNVRDKKERREIAISGGTQVVQATFLDGTSQCGNTRLARVRTWQSG